MGCILTFLACNIVSYVCHVRNKKLESADHVLVTCSFARKLISWILKLCVFSMKCFTKVEDIVGHCSTKKKVLIVIIYGVSRRQEMTKYLTESPPIQQRRWTMLFPWFLGGQIRG